jgi:hypothetical protein
MERHFDAALDAEVATIKAHYNDRLKEALSDAISFVPEAGAPFVGRPENSVLRLRSVGDGEGEAALGSSDDGEPELSETDIWIDPYPAADPLEGLEDGEEDADPGDEEADADGAGGLLRADPIVPPAVDRNIDHPFLISLGEFSESPPGWQALTLTYFAGDKIPTLVDDKNEPIPHYHKIVGKINGKKDFGGISGDPNIRYVRNLQQDTDYEIVYDPRSYAEGVLNDGRPNGGS